MLTEGNTTQLLASLMEGRLDVAFVRPGVHSFAGIALYQIASEPMKIVLPVKHAARIAPAAFLWRTLRASPSC